MSKSICPKLQALKENGTLNPHPEKVADTLFQEEDFFDARDLLQVKYEMLRRVRQEGWPVARAAETFGFSRPSYYKAQEAFDQDGLGGLFPKKRGPREAHKMTGEIVMFANDTLGIDLGLSTTLLAHRIEKRFGVSVHPRSIERALKRREKKTS
ncbi:MAG: helix-turn-helix domain containing protein [Magnetococcales bacterium]|nr:helix-turn-helix domain containing protein [Magnetococcales bacterium]